LNGNSDVNEKVPNRRKTRTRDRHEAPTKKINQTFKMVVLSLRDSWTTDTAIISFGRMTPFLVWDLDLRRITSSFFSTTDANDLYVVLYEVLGAFRFFDFMLKTIDIWIIWIVSP